MEKRAVKFNERLIDLNTPSIKSRFAVSFYSNVLKGGFSFATGLIIAKGLGPENYGNYAFLLASFLSLVQLLDMGTSSAFYTFLSQKPRGLVFIAYFVSWQALQILLSLSVIAFVLPETWIKNIWLGQSKEWIILALMAVFMQQSAWQTIIHIGESQRLTQRVQHMNIFIASIHLSLVAVIWNIDVLSIKVLFMLVIAEYFLAIVVACILIPIRALEGEVIKGMDLFHEYRIYCTPLIIHAGLGFIYIFYDRWLLQHFGGAKEQAFYSIGYQFATVCLITTVSISKIFWKEISEAHEKQDFEKKHYMYSTVSRCVFIFGAILSGFLIPWSNEIVLHLLGPAYLTSVAPLAIMFLLPVHQGLIRTAQTMLLATSATRIHLLTGGIMMAINLPVAYLVLASNEAFIPGWGLGALGMSIKMVVLQIVGTNLVTWWVSREFKWKFEWVYQVVGLGGAVFLGWAAYQLVMEISSFVLLGLIWKIGISFLLYTIMMGIFLWSFPWIMGMTRKEIILHISSTRELLFKKPGGKSI